MTELFTKNMVLLKNMDNVLAESSVTCIPKRWKIVTDQSGSLNLVDSSTGDFLHNPEGPLKEAERWFDSIKIQNVNTIFVYGIGLGYYYEPLREWLKEKENYLIFIEDDFEVIHHFLGLQRATEILSNPKVRLLKLPQKMENTGKFEELMLQFSLSAFQVTALMSYIKKKVDKLVHLSTMIDFMINTNKWVRLEHDSLGLPFYSNFYVNLLKLPFSKVGSSFFEKFKGKPAIICGAGPSLKKNINELKNLSNKVLIIAGGTAINALNQAGINPHLGVGIDPNEDQALRVLTNLAFMVPYFYHQRMNHTALSLLHGDLYYQNTKNNYPISYWIENKLSIPSVGIDGGYNVVNTSFEIAYALGCSPIITIGTDLAYSDGDSYAPIISSHPLAEGSLKFITKTESEELVRRNDIYGKPILTLWKWMLESTWYSKFIVNNPGANVINATEGGIGFPDVPNMTLKEVEESYLTVDYDFEGLIHALSIESAMPKDVNLKTLESILCEAERGLERIITYTKALIKGFAQIDANTKEIEDNRLALEKEDGYIAFLEAFDKNYSRIIQKEDQSLEISQGVLTPEEIALSKGRMQSARYELLTRVALLNNDYIKKTLLHMKTLSEKKSDLKRSVPVVPNFDDYIFNETEFAIKDPTLGIAFTETPRDTLEKKKQVENIPKSKISWEFYKKEGLLHGPSVFLDNKGSIISKSWYRQGKKTGLSCTYYEDGALKSYQGFNEGHPHKDHLFYYEDGNIRARIGYHLGKLDGSLELYHPNGVLKRLIEYKEGEKDGEEALYTENSERIIEAHYSKGLPFKVARYFSPKGDVLKEISFNDQGEVTRILVQDSNGKLVLLDSRKGQDYFDSITNETVNLTESLSNVFKNLKGFFLEIKNDQKFFKAHEDLINTVNDGMLEIEKELEHLTSFGTELIHESNLGKDGKEPIWKTPSTKKILDAQVTILQNSVRKGLEAIQIGVDQVVSAYVDYKKKHSGDM